MCVLDLGVYDPDTSPVLATKLQELALGPWAQRPNRGHLLSPNPPTAGP